VVLFTDLFGCLQAAACLMPRPAQTPLASTIQKIQDQCAEREDDENACEQHECRQHFLNKIDLQSDKNYYPDP